MQRRMWSMIVVRDNSVESIKHFDNYQNGLEYTVNFLEKVDSKFNGEINFLDGEYYSSNDFTVGLYSDRSG